MKHFLLFYEGGPDYGTRRAPLRPAHLQHARDAHGRGELVQAGGYAEPVDGSVFVFRGESAVVAESFAASDPYVTGGVVTRWWVREWTTVVGPDSTVPTILST